MTPSFLQTAHRPKSLIADALAGNTPLTVTFRHDEGWGVFKARILAMLDESNEVVLEYPRGGDSPIPELAPGQVIGIAFRKGHKKCIGDTWIHKRCTHTSRTGQKIPAFTLICPSELYELQRRLFYRVEIPSRSPIDVQFWAGCETAEAPPKDDIYRGTMIDLSAGGLSVRLTPDQAPRFDENQEVTCVFTTDPDEPPIRITARVRYSNTSASEVRLGLQFVGADATHDGREKLDRIARFVTYLQSQEKRSRRS